MAKKVGWSNTDIGNRKSGSGGGKGKGKTDDEEFDLGEFDLGDKDTDGVATVNDDTPGEGDEDVDDPELENLLGDLKTMEPEQPAKGKSVKAAKENKGVDKGPETKATKKTTKSKPEPTAGTPKVEEKVAKDLGLDLRMQCPVCRSLDACDCDEDDRTFVLRTRFEEKIEKVARCPRDQAPLSLLYLPRPGARPPFRLSQFTATYGCAVCHGDALATVLLSRREG